MAPMASAVAANCSLFGEMTPRALLCTIFMGLTLDAAAIRVGNDVALASSPAVLAASRRQCSSNQRCAGEDAPATAGETPALR